MSVAFLLSMGITLTSGRKEMANYIYGIATSTTVIAMLDVIDTNVSNDLWYWVTLYTPF
tara:strand:+ start:176 stop:352 length:177 start_codon:yes stop_codon:yes gene_type:complete